MSAFCRQKPCLMAEIIKSYPLLFVLLVIGPCIGGMIGTYLGYDNLAARLRNEQQADRIEQRAGKIGEDIKELQLPIETLKRYEHLLAAAGQNRGVFERILKQYDQLRVGISTIEKFRGRPDQEERLASAEHTLNELKAIIGTTTTAPGPGGQALIIKTALNTFGVTFAVPMRIPPDLKFMGLPEGVSPNVIEKTNIGFIVIFMPESISVEKFGFSASAEL
jgi:hypothetical protein